MLNLLFALLSSLGLSNFESASALGLKAMIDVLLLRSQNIGLKQCFPNFLSRDIINVRISRHPYQRLFNFFPRKSGYYYQL
jgi:hypothetical protein